MGDYIDKNKLKTQQENGLQKDKEQFEEPQNIVTDLQDQNINLNLQNQDVQEESNDIFDQEIKNVSQEEESVKTLPGNASEVPEFIGINERYSYARKEGEDSPKMIAVRKALVVYHHPEDHGMTERQATQYLIEACDKYCSGRFEVFKRGRGLKRLQEVKALREKAKERLSLLNEQKESRTLITDTETAGWVYQKGEREMAAGASLGKKAVAAVATFFGFTVVNIAKIVALQPLWGKEAFAWRPDTYYFGTIRALDRTFGRIQEVDELTTDEEGKAVYTTKKKRATFTSTSLKDKDRSETYAKEKEMMSEDFNKYLYSEGEDEHPEELDDEYEDYETLKQVKIELRDEYSKDKPDLKKIKKLESEMKTLDIRVQKFSKMMKEDYPEENFTMDELDKMDRDICSLKLQKAKINERKVNENSTGMLSNLFGNEKYGAISTSPLIKKKWLETGEIPEGDLNRLIDDTFNEWKIEGEELSENERKLIRYRYKERFAQSIRATKSYQQTYYSLYDDMPTMSSELNFELKSQNSSLQRDIYGILMIRKDMSRKEKEEFLVEFTNAYKNKDTKNMTKNEEAQYLAEKEKGQKKQVSMLKPIIEQALSITDMKKYDVQDDDELIEKYYLYRDELEYGFVLSAMVDNYIEIGGELSDEDYRTIKATAMTLQSIKAYYDGRMDILRNPCYFLTYDEILKNMDSKDIDDRTADIEEYYEDTGYKKYLDAQVRMKDEANMRMDSWGMVIFHGKDAEETFKVSLEEQKKQKPLSQVKKEQNK